MKNLRFCFIKAIALIGCQKNSSDFQTSQSPSTSSPTTITESPSVQPEQKKPSVIPNDLLISDQGIGSAKLGMKFGELKEKLGKSAQFKIVSPFIVDFEAIAISKSGEIQYYIIYPSGTTFKDSDVIELLLTDNPNYRTAEGVGMGTTIKEAQAIYGEATLSYNTQSESREMVKFANYPSKNIIFMPTRNSDDFAGIYPPSSAEYNETKKFNDSATIGSIFVGN